METKKGPISMTSEEMFQRLSEWFFQLMSVVVLLEDEEENKRSYSILETDTKEVVFEHKFVGNNDDVGDLIVSTAGIKNEELRGLVEQCWRLDQQIEEYKKPKQQKTNISVKGE